MKKSFILGLFVAASFVACKEQKAEEVTTPAVDSTTMTTPAAPVVDSAATTAPAVDSTSAAH